MPLLQAIRHHIARSRAVSGGALTARVAIDDEAEMSSEDQFLEDELASLRRAVSNLQEFKKAHEEKIQDLTARVTRLERVTEAEDWK